MLKMLVMMMIKVMMIIGIKMMRLSLDPNLNPNIDSIPEDDGE